ncbi:MAG: hypothetical protein JSS94_10400 [Bacteroidetes bacterium]|nr:hypothetical protein [Bacteroidota bacterium]
MVLLAFFVNSFIYFGFANVYSTSILNHADFITQFHSGIYQYRILSGQLLLWIYDVLGRLNIDYSIFKFKFLNENSEPKMYLSLYILNVTFAMLSAWILYLIFTTKEFIATHTEKLLMISVIIMTMALSQFVLVPYDYSSYFFMVLFIYGYLYYSKTNSKIAFLGLALLLILATLNRESSALSLSWVATITIHRKGLSRKSIIDITVFAIIFIGVYLGLRLINGHFSTNDGNLLLENFTQPKNILGFGFCLLLFILTLCLAKSKAQQKLIFSFHFFALPYMLMCFYSGILYEIRLYIPILICSIILSRLDLGNIKN